MRLATSEIETITKRYIDQSSLSCLLQRTFERKLAGLALLHPLEVLAVIEELKSIWIDQVAADFLQLLDEHKDQLLDIDNDARLELCNQLALDFEDGEHYLELIDRMNSTWDDHEPVLVNEDGTITFRDYSIPSIVEGLLKRIRDQEGLRAGLPDLCQFSLEALSR